MIDHSAHVSDICAALAAAARELRNVEKSEKAEAGRARFAYANLAGVLSVVRPVLASHGLFVTFGERDTPDAGEVVTVCRVWHSSGQWIQTHAAVPLDRQGGPHGYGSSSSYGRRFAVLGILGLAAGKDDDDATQVTHAFEQRVAATSVDRLEVQTKRDTLAQLFAAKVRAAGHDPTPDLEARFFGALIVNLSPTELAGKLERFERATPAAVEGIIARVLP